MRAEHNPVTSNLFLEWAEGALGEWLPGYTGPDENTNIQYRITMVGPDTYSVTDAMRRMDPRVFTVRVSVTEIE